MQHIIQKDDSERFFVYNHLNPTPEQETDPQHILNKLYRFQEKRADILALTKNKRYAQGNIAFSQYLLGLWGRDGDGIEHPTETMRIALASLFLNTFAKNQELIA